MSDFAPPPDDDSRDNYWKWKLVTAELTKISGEIAEVRAVQKTNHTDNTKKIDDITTSINKMQLDLSSFALVKQIVYAGIGVALIAVLTAILALVVAHGIPLKQ